MMNSRIRLPLKRLLPVPLALAVLAALGLHPTTSHAVDQCPSDTDMCVFVNSNLDTNARDSVMTLREAILVVDGTLDVLDLSIPERGQVVINMPPGWGPDEAGPKLAYTPPGFGGPGGIGRTGIYFDTSRFCLGCSMAARTIVLSPSQPSCGGASGSALPALEISSGSSVSIGLGYSGGVEVATNPIIDGQYSNGCLSGMAIGETGSAWIRGVTLRRFSGTAIDVAQPANSAVTIGSDGNGIHDDAEVVTFDSNGANITYH